MRVTAMYALWLVRSAWRDAPVPDQRIENATGVEQEWSRDQREELEKAGIGSIRPDMVFDGRHIASGVIQLDFYRAREALKGRRWAILASRDLEFLVPDVPVGLSLPVTPRLCLVPGRGYRMARRPDVERLNVVAVRCSRRYFFASSRLGAGGFVDGNTREPVAVDGERRRRMSVPRHGVDCRTRISGLQGSLDMPWTRGEGAERYGSDATDLWSASQGQSPESNGAEATEGGGLC